MRHPGVACPHGWSIAARMGSASTGETTSLPGGTGISVPGHPGGRPAEHGVGRSLSDVRQRMRAVRVAQEERLVEACIQTGSSRASIYRWLEAYHAGGIAALRAESRRPHRLQPRVPAWLEHVVITIRLLTYWNSKRIAAEMERGRSAPLATTTSTASFPSQIWAGTSTSPRPSLDRVELINQASIRFRRLGARKQTDWH